MAKNFKALREKMSPDAQRRAATRTQHILDRMPLQALRQAREMSQATIADLLGNTQPQVSKIEHQTDLYLSTLRRYVEALGGELGIFAKFPEGSIRVDLFSHIGSASELEDTALVSSGSGETTAKSRDKSSWTVKPSFTVTGSTTRPKRKSAPFIIAGGTRSSEIACGAEAA